jgi:uncharacterized membrane protein
MPLDVAQSVEDTQDYLGAHFSLLTSPLWTSLVAVVLVFVICFLTETSTWSGGIRRFLYLFIGIGLILVIHDTAIKKSYDEKHEDKEVKRVVGGFQSYVGGTTNIFEALGGQRFDVAPRSEGGGDNNSSGLPSPEI